MRLPIKAASCRIFIMYPKKLFGFSFILWSPLYGLKHGKLPFGFLLRTSAIQTSLIALGLSSGDQ